MKAPLLAVDGDSIAHRAYHALPKSIRRAEKRPANMIVGFANMLLGLWDQVQPRAVLVGFDSLDTPTYRHEAFPAYQSGREFPDDLLEQLDLLPELVGALGFASAKAPGYEADDFLGAVVAAEEKKKRPVVVATSDRDLFQLASELTTILQPVRGVSELTRVGPGRGARALRRRAEAGARLHRAARRPLRPPAGREGRRSEDGRVAARAVRDARGGARGRPLRGAGGGVAALPANRDGGRLCPSPSATRPDAYLGRGVRSRRALGPRGAWLGACSRALGEGLLAPRARPSPSDAPSPRVARAAAGAARALRGRRGPARRAGGRAALPHARVRRAAAS